MRIVNIGGRRKSFLVQHFTSNEVREPGRKWQSLQTFAIAVATPQQQQSSESYAIDVNQLDKAQRLLHRIVRFEKCGRLPRLANIHINKLGNYLNERLIEASTLLLTDYGACTDESNPKHDIAKYVALRFASLIRYAMLQIRLLLCFTVYGYAFLVLCIMSYPFQGRRILGALLSISFLVLLVLIGYLFVQMDKDGILSRLENSTEGKVSYGGVLSHVIRLGGIPLLAILASQFPEISDFLFSWVRPALSAARPGF
jgi:hypothetical protein